MRRVILICYIVSVTAALYGQQRPNTTLFMTNPFALNPAIAGTYNFFQVISNHRFQWAGFEDAPVTNSLSFFGPTVNHPMGWGGTIAYDVAGKFGIGSAHGSYAYYYPINEDLKVSMGLNLGILQYNIDMADLTREDEADPTYFSDKQKFLLPDASVGAYLYSSTYYVGFVATQLINNRIRIGDEPKGLSKLKSHFYLTGGYFYSINREWSVEPSIIIKKVVPAPYQLDFNVRGWYRNMVWFGLAYRTQEAISVLMGYQHDSKIQIGYAYDVVLNAMRANTLGSHEIILNYRFNRIKD